MSGRYTRSVPGVHPGGDARSAAVGRRRRGRRRVVPVTVPPAGRAGAVARFLPVPPVHEPHERRQPLPPPAAARYARHLGQPEHRCHPHGDGDCVLRARAAAVLRPCSILPRQLAGSVQGDARVVAVGASSVFRGAVLHAAAAGRRPRSAARRRGPARHTTRLLTGRGVTRRRRDRRAAHPGEVVPGRRRPLPQLAQHHARARRARRVLHAPGDDARHSVDVSRGLPRAAAPALTHAAAAPRIVLLTTVHKYTRHIHHAINMANL